MANFQPCKDCKDRVLNCHSTCAKYKRFTEEVKEAKRKERQITNSYTLREAKQMSRNALTKHTRKGGKHNGTD